MIGRDSNEPVPTSQYRSYRRVPPTVPKFTSDTSTLSNTYSQKYIDYSNKFHIFYLIQMFLWNYFISVLIYILYLKLIIIVQQIWLIIVWLQSQILIIIWGTNNEIFLITVVNINTLILIFYCIDKQILLIILKWHWNHSCNLVKMKEGFNIYIWECVSLNTQLHHHHHHYRNHHNH